MRKITLWCVAALLTLMLLPLSAHAGGFDILSAPEIQSLDMETLAVTWDEPDKPGNEDSPNRNGLDDLIPMDNWSCLGWYTLRIYYADHVLTAEEWPESPLKVPESLELVSEHNLGAKEDPAGIIERNWLTKGSGAYYFGIVAYTTGGQYLYRDGADRDLLECAYSAIEREVRVFRTPYELDDVTKLPVPENIRFENGQLRWSYDWELANRALFRMDLYSQGEEHQSGHGLYLYGGQRDYAKKEFYIDLTGDYVRDLKMGVTYNLAFWDQSRDYLAYSDSEEILLEDFLPLSRQRLASPRNVTIDEDSLVVSWDPVDDPNLMDYQLTVYYDDGNTGPRSVGYAHPQVPQESINSYVLQYGSGTYYVTVRARTNDVTKKADGVADPKAPGRQAGQEAWNALAHASITVSETPLPTISLADSAWGADSYLRWAPVEGAASYEVQVYRRASGGEPYKESYKQYTDEPVFWLSTPTPVQEEEIAVKVRAISANALQNASGEWSDFSPDYAYSDAPALPGVKKKKYNKDDRTISWEPITGEDAAYVGGYVVEISFSGKDDVGNWISINPGWTVITQGDSVSLNEFSRYFTDSVPTENVSYSVWAYSSDLSKRNHSSNNGGGTGLPDGALESVVTAPWVTVTDVKREDGSCSFDVNLSGDCDGARLFAAAYEASGRMRTVRVLDAAETMPVTLAGLEKDDVIRVMLADENSKPLAPVTPVE